MLFMVVEQYKNHGAKQVYLRAEAKGRMLPDGLPYVDSWVDSNFKHCFQLMKSEDPGLFQKWIKTGKIWSNLGFFQLFHQRKPRRLFFILNETFFSGSAGGYSRAPPDSPSTD